MKVPGNEFDDTSNGEKTKFIWNLWKALLTEIIQKENYNHQIQNLGTSQNLETENLDQKRTFIPTTRYGINSIAIAFLFNLVNAIFK